MLRTTLVILAIGGLSLSGCGTFSDAMCGPITDHAYYRGVRFDVEVIKEGGPRALMAVDIPFSAVADTLLVPYLAYLHLTYLLHERLSHKSEEQITADNHGGDTAFICGKQ